MSSELESLRQQRQAIHAQKASLLAEDRMLWERIISLTPSPPAPSPSFTAPDHDPALPIQGDPPPWGTDSVGLVSYPRSGNSLLRRVVERVTGTVTGSDGRPDRKLVRQLSDMGMAGEGVMDPRMVWCIKTHYPERVGRAALRIKRAVVVVRNPFDCVASFFHMMLTDSHQLSVKQEDLQTRFAELWGDFVREEIGVWVQFHAHWREAANTIPCLVVRYEDLVQHRDREIARIAKFLYSSKDLAKALDDVEIAARLASLSLVPQSALGLYAPKEADALNESSSLKQNDGATVTFDAEKEQAYWRNPPLPLDVNKPGYLKCVKLYSDELYRYVLATTRSDLVRYGYWRAAIKFRPEHAPDLAPYVDRPLGECIIANPQNRFAALNTKIALRPQTKSDPNGRGFDLRWEDRMSVLPTPMVEEQQQQARKDV